jgi:hypothetical protein
MAGEQEVEGRLPTRSLGGTRRGGCGGRRSRRGGRGCRAEERLQPSRRPRPTPALVGIRLVARRVPWAGATEGQLAEVEAMEDPRGAARSWRCKPAERRSRRWMPAVGARR